jgi:tRNA threonylcarbamoyladenosine biosynthesis protein TsaB
MRVLALDTTTRLGSVALLEDERVLVAREGDHTRTHAERLPGELVDVVRAAGLSACDVDVFAVAAGPGSFTGLRIGIAAMQGLAVVCGRRMVAVSVLEALGHVAADGLEPDSLVGAWMDAHRGDVFSALYRVGRAESFTSERLAEIDPPRVDRPDTIWREWRGRTHRPRVLAGDGAVLHAARTAEATILPAPPLAAAIGLVALRRARAHATTSPAGVQPLYVRRPDAEVARDRQRDA